MSQKFEVGIIDEMRHVIFSTAVEVVQAQDIATIIEQSATQLFMSNPKAQASDYCGGFGLTAHELDLVRSLPGHLRCVLIKQGGNSVVARLDMGNMPDAITVLSGRESSVRKLDELRRVHGDAPSEWMPLLLQDAQEVAFAPRPAATTGMQS